MRSPTFLQKKSSTIVRADQPINTDALNVMAALGYFEGDRVYVRCIPAKKTPMAVLQSRGMAWQPPGKDKAQRITVKGYLTLRGNSATFTREYASGKTKTYQNGFKQLQRLNLQGYGVYFIPNPGGNEDSDIVEARSIFFEDDERSKDEQWERLREIEAALGVKFLVVETHKSLHCYGLLDAPTADLAVWPRLQQRLIQRQDSDAGIWNPSRLMRLPGFYHWRWDGETLRATPVRLQQSATGAIAPSTLEAVLPPWDSERWQKQSREYQPTEATGDPWDIRNFAQYLDGIDSGNRRGWLTCKCPAHNGESSDSLHIEESTGAFKCHAGCDSKAVYSAALDLAVSRGYQRPKGKAGPKSFFIPESQKLTRVTHQRHAARLADAMQDVDLSNAKLIGVKAPCGNGKTFWVTDYLKPYQDTYTPIYPITYRETLERGYGGKFGVPTRTEVEEYRDSIGITGQTFCIHSMRPDCKTQFDAATAEPGVVLLDEVRGILWDLDDSGLVNRGKVIPQFVEFLQKCHAAGYPIIVMDANLTDAELNAIAEVIGIADDKIVTVQNAVKHWDGRPVYTAPPAALTIKLREHISRQRGPVLCTTSSQKPGSRYGTISLERECRKAGLKRVLRVDQETKRDQSHPASKLMLLLESADFELARGFIQEWDGVVLSPVIEAGFSLEVYGYFTAQFSFNQGNLPVENCIQQMLRLRDKNVPIFCSVPNNRRGMMSALRRGNGSDDPHVLRQGELMRAKGNLHQLLAPSSDGGSINTALLDYWFTAAARQNASIEHYQDLIEAYLTEMGHVVSSLEDCPDSDAQKAESRELKQSAVGDQVERALENADAENIDDAKADELKQQAFLSFDEQRAIEKHGIAKRYQCEVTPGLALLDALSPEFKGQTQLLFYLTLGRSHLKDKEQSSLNRLAEDGAVFLPDLNKRLSGYRVHSLELLKIKALMDKAGDEISNDDALIEEIGKLLEHCSTDVKRLMGINFDDRWGTIRRINHICKTWLGMPLLRRCKTKGRRGERRKVVYEVLQLVRPADEVPARFAGADFDPFDNKDLDSLTDAYRSYLLSHWLQNAEANAPCSASV